MIFISGFRLGWFQTTKKTETEIVSAKYIALETDINLKEIDRNLNNNEGQGDGSHGSNEVRPLEPSPWSSNRLMSMLGAYMHVL